MAAGISAGLTPTEGRKFGLLVGGAFLLLGALLWRRGRMTGSWVALGLGGALVLAGLAIPGRLGPIYNAWMGLAKMISKVTTPVFMSVIFFLVLTPAGFLVRLFGHRPLSRSRSATSYWLSRAPGERQGAMDHQF